MNPALARFIVVLSQVLTFAILARAILTWFPVSRDNPVVAILFHVTEPILMPLRRIIPTIGFFDLSPMIAIIVLQVLSGFVQRYA